MLASISVYVIYRYYAKLSYHEQKITRKPSLALLSGCRLLYLQLFIAKRWECLHYMNFVYGIMQGMVRIETYNDLSKVGNIVTFIEQYFFSCYNGAALQNLPIFNYSFAIRTRYSVTALGDGRTLPCSLRAQNQRHEKVSPSMPV